MKKTILLLLLFIAGINHLVAQQLRTVVMVDVNDFKKLRNNNERKEFLKQYNTYDKNTYEKIYQHILREDNISLLIYWHYIKTRIWEIFNYSAEDINESLNKIIELTKIDKGYEAERIVAQIHLDLNNYNSGILMEQELYSSYLTKLSRMKSIGFDKFYYYQVDWILYQMGRTFFTLGDYEKALESLKNSVRYTEIKEGIFYTLSLNLIQTIYANLKKFPDAIRYAQYIYDANQNINPQQDPKEWRSFFWQGLSSLDMASYYMEMQDFKNAEFYSNRGYKLYQIKYNYTDPKDLTQTIAEFDALQVIIRLKLKTNKVEEAKMHFARVEQLRPYIRFQDPGNFFKSLPYYYNNVNYYKIKQDYKKAFAYLQLANQMEDSLAKQNDKRKLWQIEMRVDAERYQNQIESAMQASRQEEWLKNLATFTLALVVLLGSLIIRRIKKDHNTIIFQKSLLEKSLYEKERFLQEIHHRVKNNLQIISGLFEKQARNMQDEQAKKLMKEGQDRVYSIALVHQNLYQSEDLSTLGIKNFISTLINNIERSYKSENQVIEVNYEIDDSKLSIDTAIPTGLIINELITNCYKYAFKNRPHGKIDVSFYKKESHYYLNVTDDGVGIPDDVHLFNRQTLGMNLVKGLVRQLDGVIELESNKLGTRILIYFKIP
ncbi:MAG TPA: sensor histidine kinase [Rhodothermales bacterium]|nr:sensor histidine kinase [Rhodothermales bacterium]